MEDLTKQQMVLLTILASFITSIATSVTIVAILTDSAPTITQTINRFVERTVRTVSEMPSTPPAQKPALVASPAVAMSESEQLVSAAEKNLAAMAVISKKTSDGAVILGNGFSVGDGLIATDESILSKETDGLIVRSRSGKEYSAEVVLTNEKTGVALLLLHDGSEKTTPVVRAISLSSASLVLGQSVFSLGGKTGAVLGKGIVTSIDDASSTSTPSEIGTTIVLSKSDRGGPLFALSGDVAGIAITSSLGEQYFLSAVAVSDAINGYTKGIAKSVP